VSTIWVNIVVSAGTLANPNNNSINFQLEYFDALGNALPTTAANGATLAQGATFPQYAHFAAGPATNLGNGYSAPLPNSVRIRWLLAGNSATFSISVMGR
jgi:hypothetical protein